jgi:hypothetical protein
MSGPANFGLQGAAFGGGAGVDHGLVVDEERNRREFEAARQAWLRSGGGSAHGKPASNAAGAGTKPGSSKAGTKTGAAGAKPKRAVPDHTDRLQAETRKMDERLALLRRTMAAEKEKREVGTAAITSTGARSRPGGSKLHAGVSSRIDRTNTLLEARESLAREARQVAAERARAEAEARSVREAEAARLAALKAGGHTLLTYAAPEPAQQWVLAKDEQAEQEAAAAATAQASMAATPSLAIHGAGGAGSSFGGVRTAAPRKQVTAADMLRTKRQLSASASAAASRQGAAAAPSGIAVSATAVPTSAIAATSVPPAAAAATARTIDCTQFNLLPTTRPAAAAATANSLISPAQSLRKGAAGSLWGDTDLDEEANARAFAEARADFLRSMQPPQPPLPQPPTQQQQSESEGASGSNTPGGHSTLTPQIKHGSRADAGSATDGPNVAQAAIDFGAGDPTSAAALPSNWWEQPEEGAGGIGGGGDRADYHNVDGGLAASAAAAPPAPGSLLDGPAFDEDAANAAFAEARKEWVAAQQSPAAAAAAGPRASAKAAAASSSVAPAAGAPATAAVSAAKQSCYNCYKLFAPSSSPGCVLDSGDSGKWFCSAACRDAAWAEMRVVCSAETCRHRRVARKDATRSTTASGATQWICNTCVAAVAAASSSTAPDTAAGAAAEEDEPIVSLFGEDGMLAGLQAALQQGD